MDQPAATNTPTAIPAASQPEDAKSAKAFPPVMLMIGSVGMPPPSAETRKTFSPSTLWPEYDPHAHDPFLCRDPADGHP